MRVVESKSKIEQKDISKKSILQDRYILLEL